jgi:hypothetical protein
MFAQIEHAGVDHQLGLDMFPICSYSSNFCQPSGNRRFDTSPGGCRLIFDIVDQKAKADAARTRWATPRLAAARGSSLATA